MTESTAVTRIVQHQFVDEKGSIIPYERLALIGSINGQPLTLEIKLSNGEMQLAKAILASTEKLTTTTNPMTRAEEDLFKDINRQSDNIDLEDE